VVEASPRSSHLPEVVELLGEFGLRPGELFHLTWGSVDWNLDQGENRGALSVEEQGRTRMLGGDRCLLGSTPKKTPDVGCAPSRRRRHG